MHGPCNTKSVVLLCCVTSLTWFKGFRLSFLVRAPVTKGKRSVWLLAVEELGELAVGPTECGQSARRGCLFAWNFSVTRSAAFTAAERSTRPITTLSLRYDSPPAYRLIIQPAKNHALHYSFVMSVRPSACISTAPIGRISVKLYIVFFYASLSWNFKFGYTRANMSFT
jgi:hypothetical protein